jgi:hypothetical protein
MAYLFVPRVKIPNVYSFNSAKKVYGTFSSKEGGSDGKEGGSDGNECCGDPSGRANELAATRSLNLVLLLA